jgi:hypothetical protein
MKLETFSIRRIGYGANEGKYEGRVSFSGGHGDITLILDPSISNKFLEFCGPQITEAASKAAVGFADTLRQAVIESVAKPVEQLA